MHRAGTYLAVPGLQVALRHALNAVLCWNPSESRKRGNHQHPFGEALESTASSLCDVQQYPDIYPGLSFRVAHTTCHFRRGFITDNIPFTNAWFCTSNPSRGASPYLRLLLSFPSPSLPRHPLVLYLPVFTTSRQVLSGGQLQYR